MLRQMSLSTIKDNLEQVNSNIVSACIRSGRKTDSVTLIAVSKTKPVEMLLEAYAAGARDFGENKVQEITRKCPELPSDVKWHMIGHLQRNKVKQVIDKVTLIHSVDSYRLAQEISVQAQKKGLTIPILIEVNIAGEESKGGCPVEELPALAEEYIAKMNAVLAGN